MRTAKSFIAWGCRRGGPRYEATMNRPAESKTRRMGVRFAGGRLGCRDWKRTGKREKGGGRREKGRENREEGNEEAGDEVAGAKAHG